MDPSFFNLLENLFYLISAGINDIGKLHPAIIHFPIVLLSVAPLFIILGLIFKKSLRSFYTSALILMLLGSLSIFLAVSSGDVAAESLNPNPVFVPTLDTHLRLAELSRVIFSVLSIIFLFYVSLFCLSLNQKLSNRTHVILISIFLTIYIFGLLILFNTAHYGAKLVHHYGIKSALYFQAK